LAGFVLSSEMMHIWHNCGESKINGLSDLITLIPIITVKPTREGSNSIRKGDESKLIDVFISSDLLITAKARDSTFF
jgi:hypothetical protein